MQNCGFSESFNLFGGQGEKVFVEQKDYLNYGMISNGLAMSNT